MAGKPHGVLVAVTLPAIAGTAMAPGRGDRIGEHAAQ